MLKTTHRFIQGNANAMTALDDESVDLVVTSPPYPMIEMWDAVFTQQNPKIAEALAQNDGNCAFERMHVLLDEVWRELFRVLKPGGIACINIGDATRTIDGEFRLYSNHSRILQAFLKLGFDNLPNILWRKQTNAPNKFMGSGMLPPGAYVTLEHEYILIFRKGSKRGFKSAAEKEDRHRSAYFWEERNTWFSDIWWFKGTRQRLGAEAEDKKMRARSGAYPFELAYRLVNMFSVKDDLVLDPFLGTGTTLFAAMAACRNSIGFDIDKHFLRRISETTSPKLVSALNETIQERFRNHENFVRERISEKGESAIKHRNEFYDFPVMTTQERRIFINFVKGVARTHDALFEADYFEKPFTSIQGRLF